MSEFTWWFTEPFTENAQKLYELLYTKEFDSEKLKRQLDSGSFNAVDVNQAAYRYVDDCACVAEGFITDIPNFESLLLGEPIPDIESSHLVDVIRILLDHGLDPNKTFTYDDGGKTNIMDAIRFVYNHYQAADALCLMFEHGGNPSICIDEESLIRELNTDLLFYLCGDVEYRYIQDAFVHAWMVFIGYGARLEDGRMCIDPVGTFDISNLRNHRQYYYGIIHSDRADDGIEVCFFDKNTNWEVARY